MLSKSDKLKHALNRNMISSFQNNVKTNPVVMCLSILVSCYTYLIYSTDMFIRGILLCGVYTIMCSQKHILHSYFKYNFSYYATLHPNVKSTETLKNRRYECFRGP